MLVNIFNNIIYIQSFENQDFILSKLEQSTQDINHDYMLALKYHLGICHIMHI